LGYLKEILIYKKGEMKKVKKSLKYERIALESKERKEGGFLKSVKKGKIRVIAEIKKASPSKGIFNDNLDIVRTALLYDKFKSFICGISVLTESLYFKGSPENIRVVKENSDLPVLRKDFIFSECQVYESAAMGADCILLICSLLGSQKLLRLYKLAKNLGMEALIEVHSENELGKALYADAQFIGINNRDLKTMRVDKKTTYDILKSTFMEDITNEVFVCESGIGNVEDMKKLFARGINTFLIGGYFMESGNLEKTLTDMELKLKEEKLI